VAAVIHARFERRCKGFAMSMIGIYRRVSLKELARLKSAPDSVMDFLCPEHTDVHYDHGLDIGKAWHAIHFLLNNDKWGGEYPLVCAVMGGTSIDGTDVGYGPARSLTPEEVRDVANALDEISSLDLLERFDADVLNQEQIYPQCWRNVPEEREFVGSEYQALVKFFNVAAQARDAMVLYLG
jgi:uncharacterized protein DUF1877